MLNYLNKSDKTQIEEFVQKCISLVGEKNLITCYLHGSATRNRKHNDLDVLALCFDNEIKSKLEEKFGYKGLDVRPYIDACFSSVDTFINVCKKPFSDVQNYSRLGKKIIRIHDEQRLNVTISILHGMPIYNEERGLEILKEAENYLRNSLKEEFDCFVENWEEQLLKRIEAQKISELLETGKYDINKEEDRCRVREDAKKLMKQKNNSI